MNLSCAIKPPSLPSSATVRGHAGHTLVEALISIGLSGLVLTALIVFSFFMARSFIAIQNYDDLNRSSRNALDVMSRDIRQAKAVTTFGSSQLVFLTPAGGTFSYTYNTNAGTLVRLWTNGAQSVLLTNCDYLAFDISQRNPSNGFAFYPAGSATNAKLVDVTWECSRTILGSKANTETIQTAKIVIRN